MDTLPSEERSSFSGQRGITPAFGYGPPHPSARRTSTFLNNALLSTHYGAVRLLRSVRVRRVALGLRGPASFPFGPRRSRGLPVLVPVVSQRARVLRLRRTVRSLASIANSRVAFLLSGESRRPGFAFFEAQSPGPPIPLSTLRVTPCDVSRKTEGQDGVAVSFLVGLFHSLQHAGLNRRSLLNAASSTGRCNTIRCINSAMLLRENHLFGCTRPKPSHGSVPAGLTLAGDFGFCFQC
jgi:hypothetical protein